MVVESGITGCIKHARHNATRWFTAAQGVEHPQLSTCNDQCTDEHHVVVHDLQEPERLVNMNATGDDHVSFFARHLAPSPCGR